MSSNATKPKAKPSRRTQSGRLVDATLQCLVTADYAGTTVWPRSMTCLMASALNSAVYCVLLTDSSSIAIMMA